MNIYSSVINFGGNDMNNMFVNVMPMTMLMNNMEQVCMMRQMNTMRLDGYMKFIDLLKSEVVPAIGCTEPIAVALAAAIGRNVLNTNPEKIEVFLSRNVYKNGMSVGIPGTGMTGLDVAAAIGAVGGDANGGLEVLRNIEENHVNLAKAMLENNRVVVKLKDVPDKLYIEVICTTGEHYSRIIIKDRHTNVILIEKDKKIYFQSNNEEVSNYSNDKIVEITIEEIYDFAINIDYESIRFLLVGADMNMKVSKEGLTNNYGLGVGRTILKNIKNGLLSDDIQNYAMAITAGGADARMGGCMYPVMSCAGSGNQGLTAMLPVIAVAEKLKANNEILVRALAISLLTTIHIKSFIGRLSAICGCGTASSIGASSAITYLLGGELKNIEYTIKNMVGNISGMICDGAKPGCALKISTAVSAAVQSAILAVNGLEISGKDGIVDNDVEKTIKNLGIIASKGMEDTDKIILDIMLCK